ncbi:hypothetical protein [Mangrovimonas cancribranchiae]|uniref:Uncharacterized protein n=1 Tax=Mangrovimonas cancribranchiae TaxID=3080055 RepID=A0AAU6P4V7_9FLAO
MIRKLHPIFKKRVTIKVLIIVLFTQFIFIHSTNAQNKNNCPEEYSIQTTRLDGFKPNIDDIKLNWDFSKTSKRSNLKLEIVIQPLNGCWNELDGTKRSEARTHTITNLNNKPTNSMIITYQDLMSKCFKWKATLISDNCSESTEWKFESIYKK